MSLGMVVVIGIAVLGLGEPIMSESSLVISASETSVWIKRISCPSASASPAGTVGAAPIAPISMPAISAAAVGIAVGAGWPRAHRRQPVQRSAPAEW